MTEREIRQRAAAVCAELDRRLKGAARGTLLPAALGLGWRVQARVWRWSTKDINPSDREHQRKIVVEVTDQVKCNGTYGVEWDYTRGQDGLDVTSTGLSWSTSQKKTPDDLRPVAVDEHHAFTGANDRANRYRLVVEGYEPGRRYFLIGMVYNQREFTTFGDVWLRLAWEG